MISKDIVVCVDAALDRDTSAQYREQPLAQHWARVAKINEEAGEATAALIAWTGQNPRKGICGTLDDLLGELADAALAGVYAIQHFTKDLTRTQEYLEAAQRKHHARAHLDGPCPW